MRHNQPQPDNRVELAMRHRDSLSEGYELRRMRQGLGTQDNGPERGVGLAILICGGGLALAIGFIYWLGGMEFWHHLR